MQIIILYCQVDSYQLKLSFYNNPKQTLIKFMKISTKAALLSALVFPGLGHFHLKKYPPAIGFFSAFAYLMSIVIGALLERTEKISQQILSGEIPLEVSAISQALAEQGAGEQAGFTGYALLFIWLFSLLDAYRLGRKQENFSTKNKKS